ncbi:MAG: hypothetical protein JNK78_13360 [Planctomycetes bacterium]|nr:hypothetical protein [Planctomycetota bacterium]
MVLPPTEPHPSLVPFAPAALRSLVVFGSPVVLAYVPGRKARQDPVSRRPAFRRSPADRIVAEESFWRDGDLALTPNRHPFAAEQRILWPLRPIREPDAAMWTAACAWADAANGTALVNTIGAASTIARAHAHLLPERLAFLAALPEKSVAIDAIDRPAGAEFVAKDAPFFLVGVRGSAAARGSALAQLAAARLTAAWNVVVQDGTAWVFPRRIETPAPHFPFALGAAEVWGRWCYVDEAPFASATANDLEQALVAAGTEPLG